MTKFKGKKQENVQGRNCNFMVKKRKFSKKKIVRKKEKVNLQIKVIVNFARHRHDILYFLRLHRKELTY